jgi:hypothetical protein
LAIASRIFRPELRNLLRDHVEKLLGKALIDCDSSIGTIWAIVCLYYWKDVDDKRGYNLIGFAIRMASAAEWNHLTDDAEYKPPAETMTKDEALQSRMKRDEIRLWLLLGNLDRSSV